MRHALVTPTADATFDRPQSSHKHKPKTHHTKYRDVHFFFFTVAAGDGPLGLTFSTRSTNAARPAPLSAPSSSDTPTRRRLRLTPRPPTPTPTPGPGPGQVTPLGPSIHPSIHPYLHTIIPVPNLLLSFFSFPLPTPPAASLAPISPLSFLLGCFLV